MKEKIKTFFAFLIIIILLPYVITLIVNGQTKRANISRTDEENESLLKVRIDGQEQDMDIEEYLIGIIPSLIPVEYDIEVIKLQMTAVRTELILQRDADEDIIFEYEYMSIETMKKTIGNSSFDEIYEKLCKASEETEGKAAYYDGKMVELPYHYVSAGATRSCQDVFFNDDYPYLISVDSASDVEAENYLTLVKWESADVIEACRVMFEDLETESEDPADDIEILLRDEAGYITRMQVGNIIMSGEHFRSCLGLNSSCFTIQEYDGVLHILTKGIGHGVGFSQYGANVLAGEGLTYKDIADAYFKDIVIE